MTSEEQYQRLTDLCALVKTCATHNTIHIYTQQTYAHKHTHINTDRHDHTHIHTQKTYTHTDIFTHTDASQLHITKCYTYEMERVRKQYNCTENIKNTNYFLI